MADARAPRRTREELQLRAIKEILRATVAAMPLNEILSVIANMTIIVFDASTTFFMLAEDGHLRTVISRGELAEELADKECRDQTSQSCTAATAGKPIILQPEQIDRGDPVVGLFAAEAVPLVLLPLKAGDRVLGLLGSAVTPEASLDISFLATVAEQASSAIEHARLREESRTWQERLDAVFERISDLVLVFDRAGKLALMNAAATKLMSEKGVRLGDSIAGLVKKVSLTSHGQPLAAKETAAFRALRGERVENIEEYVKSSSGIRCFLASGVPLLTDHMSNSGIHGAVVVMRDVTERKKAEEALRASEEQLRLVVANSPDNTFRQDRDLRYLWISKAEPPFMEDQILGKTDFDVFPREEAQRLTAAKRRVLQTGSGEKGEYRATIGGQQRYFETTTEPWRNPEGEVVGIIAYVRDVTDRKLVEQFREEYISLISHDLRNPLTTIMGAADWQRRALEQRGLEREAKSAASMLATARRMNWMVQDLVESARLESGRLEMHKQPTDLLLLTSELVERLGTLEDRQRILLEVPEPLPAVQADPQHLERAITNLVGNALKYSAPDTPVVVHIQHRDDVVLVSITDEGVGIPADDLPHIFERHFRAKTAGKREGLGLGLYITKLIVEAHGGQVCAESEVGKGSTFYLTLPLA